MHGCVQKCILQREHEKAYVCVYPGAARVFVVGEMGERATAFPSSVLSPLLQSLFRGVLRYNHCSRELKKVDDTHRHMLMG